MNWIRKGKASLSILITGAEFRRAGSSLESANRKTAWSP
jgi:hypothetical protein